MSAVVVLGGADGSIDTLRTARALGHRAVCVDIRADAPGALVADELVNISTRQVDTLLDTLAQVPDLVAVVSPASDVNLPTQYAVAQALGLPCGLSADAVRASVDKGFFRATCDRLGLPGPCYVQGRPEEVAQLAATLGPLVMVKPTDSSGSRGVSCVADPARLPAATALAAGYSASGMVIAEQFLAGTDYTAEAVVVDGRVRLLGVTVRRLTPRPYFVTTEHRMPAEEIGVDTLKPVLDVLCQTLGYRWGALNVDLLRTDDGRLVVVEWGARLGGNGVAELLLLAYGVDATAAYVRMAGGEPVDLTPRFARHAGMRILDAPMAGKLVAVEGLARARRLPGVAEIVLAVTPGDQVHPYTRAGAKVGYVLASGDDPATVERALTAASDALHFTIEEEP